MAKMKHPLVTQLEESLHFYSLLFQIPFPSSWNHSFLNYNLHFFYCLIIDFFFFPSPMSQLADLLLSCAFDNIVCLFSFFNHFMKRLSHQFSQFLISQYQHSHTFFSIPLPCPYLFQILSCLSVISSEQSTVILNAARKRDELLVLCPQILGTLLPAGLFCSHNWTWIPLVPSLYRVFQLKSFLLCLEGHYIQQLNKMPMIPRTVSTLTVCKITQSSEL